MVRNMADEADWIGEAKAPDSAVDIRRDGKSESRQGDWQIQSEALGRKIWDLSVGHAPGNDGVKRGDMKTVGSKQRIVRRLNTLFRMT